MQFHIRTLLVVMVAVSLLCGVVFAAPPIVCIAVLCTILWVCPAVWVNGIVFGRGAWRAFFIGGFMAGLGPHLGALYYSVMAAASLFEVSTWAELWEGDDEFANLLNAAILLAPGLFAFLGGISGAATYWLLQPAKAERASQSPAADEYLILSGRLTTQPAPQRETPRI
jgi:hypothetical protein